MEPAPVAPTRRRGAARAATLAGIAAVTALSLPATAAAHEPGETTPGKPLPYCEALPMILIYPPPPAVIECHTQLGDFRFTLPPGIQWPF
ncbi:hypothetical protein HT102_10160 [Hoyosella sp. G463]|uniref:Uncharacterized protein n=1 Tax=Lolliginicoccus lacisalsi TaxID=2742202 RepID=A0A927JD53_9ACTN|nr:hypothetical protein [Lolliginicoccus lacisalsi]MBD8506851.1 hypothetical protein [Lolliginicoccus lacisalsi]